MYKRQPKFFPINGVFPDYANFVDVARELENKYAYNPELADEIVTEEMDALGAEKVNGIWHYEGEPVVLIGVIRTEDSRLQMGDYFANQLETIGFTVDRQYKTASEASPIWLLSDPQEGLWHFYTGGWITTAISVSYTHLDVYKRQHLPCFLNLSFAMSLFLRWTFPFRRRSSIF